MGESSSPSSNESNRSNGSPTFSEQVEDDLLQLPNMEVSRLAHILQFGGDDVSSTKEALMALVRSAHMAPYYRVLCQTHGWPVDEALIKIMQVENDKDEAACDARLKDAEDNLGDMEVLEAMFAKATHFSRIGDLSRAREVFSAVREKAPSINQKIQIALHLVRLGLFFSDLALLEEEITTARQLIDQGGDWDRRNRLKVYEGCYLMMQRDFKKAAVLFQESIATFTSDELMPYNTMVLYCVLTNVLTASRVDVKTKIVDSPEVLAVIDDIPHLSAFLNGLYECKYRQFFQAMVDLNSAIQCDKYLYAHSLFIYRELRVLAYNQFLEAYKSVKMESMAKCFGISLSFLDSELSRFIAAGRLTAKIDKVGGVIETNRPDTKNTQYQEVIKKGDHLLNRLQKLARVINI